MTIKRKSSKNKKNVSDRAAKLATAVLTGVAYGQCVKMLNEQDFMKVEPDKDGKTPKVNYKAAGLDAAAALVGSALALGVDNEMAQIAGQVIAGAATNNLVNSAVRPVLGGLGATEENVVDALLKQYDMQGQEDERITLAGSEEDKLNIV